MRQAFVSIRTRLLTAFLILLTVPFITLGVLGPFIFARTIETQAVDHTLRMIAQVDKTLEYQVRSIDQLISLIDRDEEIRSFFKAGTVDNGAALAFMDSCVITHPEIAGILLAAADDRMLSSYFDRLTRDPLIFESWYLKAAARPHELTLIARPIGRNLRNRLGLGADEIISIVKPVTAIGSSKVEGVILVDLRLDQIAEVLASSSLGRDGFLYISDAAGEIVYAPVNRVVYRVSSRNLAGSEGRTVLRIADEPFQVLYRESAYTGWKTAGVFSLSSALREVSLVRTYSLFITAFTIVLAAVLAVFFASSIARPIVELRKLMKSAETGDFSIRFQYDRDDEIGQLGNSFNAMIEEIENLIGQVYREQQEKREAELRVLQEQIKPHFLYNTLDTIQWMAQEHGAKDIVAIVNALTKLFRVGLSKGREFITVSEELQHVDSYLCIQKARYEDKFNYVIEAEPGLEKCRVLKLVLQPLVENAIYHGIKERRGSGFIRISARRTETTLVFTIADDGIGMTPTKLAELRARLAAKSSAHENGSHGPAGSASGDATDDSAVKTGDAAPAALGDIARTSGFGARNVNERIRLSFGEQYGLTYTSERGKGTMVTVLHPIMEEDE